MNKINKHVELTSKQGEYSKQHTSTDLELQLTIIIELYT